MDYEHFSHRSYVHHQDQQYYDRAAYTPSDVSNRLVPHDHYSSLHYHASPHDDLCKGPLHSFERPT